MPAAGALTISTDLRAADWLRSQIVWRTVDVGSVLPQFRRFAGDVGSLLPSGFAAHARVLHPAYRTAADPAGASIPVAWSQIATANGKVLHPQVQFHLLADREQPGLWDEPPEVGTLSRELAARLAAILERHTTTPNDSWFAVWEGWAGLAIKPGQAPVFHLPGRPYFLLHGPVSGAVQSLATDPVLDHQSANLWWPSDRAWCVATEVDLDSTYIGASQAAIRELLQTPGLEVVEVEPTDGITAYSDKVNAPARR